MSSAVTKVRIFVASPSDVELERKQMDKVVQELNVTLPALAPDKPLSLELVKWETSVAPGIGRDAQDVVNQQIGSYDIFVGIMWKRMGTPTQVAQSGTEEEFRRAYAVWERNKRLPILFYFSQAPYLMKTKEDTEQLQRVIAFRSELSEHGLVWDYSGPETFAEVVRPHLALVLGRLLNASGSTSTVVEAARRLSPRRKGEPVRAEVSKLAAQYVDVRRRMPSGSERTREMSAVASKIRSLASEANDLLPDLVLSSSPGERLAAISILQQIPAAVYLNWLAERVGVEKPFLGYLPAMPRAVAPTRRMSSLGPSTRACSPQLRMYCSISSRQLRCRRSCEPPPGSSVHTWPGCEAVVAKYVRQQASISITSS